MLPFSFANFLFAVWLLPRRPPGGSWILRSKRLRESAATRENRLECGERKRLCAAGSFRHAVACHLDVLLAKLDAACGRTSRRKACGKRCLSYSPFVCGNLFVFYGSPRTPVPTRFKNVFGHRSFKTMENRDYLDSRKRY